jgi:hypothetical protein
MQKINDSSFTEAYKIKFNHLNFDGTTKTEEKILKFRYKIKTDKVEEDFLALYRKEFVKLEILSIRYQ